MGGISLSVHPLFFAFGVYYALTGKIFIFIIYTVTAVVHELGHSFVASGMGYRLNKIVLMPFGAVVKGDTEGLKPVDQLKIALAGPFLNLCIALLFVAFWWIAPELYAFTDVVVEANLSMALVNFLPVYPLDGGRVLSSYLAIKLGSEKAFKISKVIGACFAVGLVVLFIITAFKALNLSLLFFALFVLFGAFSKAKDNRYVKIYTGLNEQALLKGMEYKRRALSKNATVKKMISIIDECAVNEIAVFDNDKEVALFSHQKVLKIIEMGALYDKLEKFI